MRLAVRFLLAVVVFAAWGALAHAAVSLRTEDSWGSVGSPAHFFGPNWPSEYWPIESIHWEVQRPDGSPPARVVDDYFHSGATSNVLTIRHALRQMNGNTYTAVARSRGQVVRSLGGKFTVFSSTGNTRLVNLSARAWVGTGANTLIVGYVLDGIGVKRVMMRGIGPTLKSRFDLGGALSGTQLRLFDVQGNVLDTNARWSTPWGSSLSVFKDLMSTFGAFPLPDDSFDSALLWGVPVGAYTAHITGTGFGGATGVALAEIYDTDQDHPIRTRLTNLSARAFVGTDHDILIAGLVVGGEGQRAVMIRGVGPSLAQFGVPNTVRTTTLTLIDAAGNVVETASGWNAEAFPELFASVGAFGFLPGAADTAMVASLPAGAYTVHMRGVNGATGVGLVEVYELK